MAARSTSGAMLNTYKFVVPEVIFTVISCTLTAYGFSRFEFKGRNLMFTLMLAMLFLPQVVLNVPQYMMYKKWGWVGSELYLAIVGTICLLQNPTSSSCLSSS
jgi:oligogalacturonide transport system permease protein